MGAVMKKASLVIGILLMILAGAAFVICLALPAITNNHVSFEESLLGLIPSAIVFFLAFVVTVISAIFVLRARKPGRTQ
jgi:uncharacterized membrane protein